MNSNDWEMIWKRQELPRGNDAELAALHETFATKSRTAARMLLVRDVAEASAGVLVCAVLALMWWTQGRAGWPMGGSILLILSVTGFFLRERVRAHRARLGAEAPLLAKLEADLAEFRHQRRLLLGIWKWYLAPIGAAIVIACVTVVRRLPAWDMTRDGRLLGGYFLLCGLLFIVVGVLNRRAVRTRLEPRIVELEKLRAELLSP